MARAVSSARPQVVTYKNAEAFERTPIARRAKSIVVGRSLRRVGFWRIVRGGR